jgi:O-antigen ligase
VHKTALRVVQAGAIAVVLAASTHRLFDLDRFFVPKELVLHLTATLAGLLTLRSIARSAVTKVDVALTAYLLLSVTAALFAQNPWLAMRALALSASGILLFWVARALRDAGLATPLLNALALAVVLAATTSLLQAYGVRLELFSLSRAPGGTLGNRNFVAHAAAFGFPVVLLAALRAGSSLGYLAGGAGAAAVTASLVLTRSRAAWLAFAAMAVVFLFSTFRFDRRTNLRLLGVLVLIGGGVAAALLLPNRLRWNSDNPYLESVKGVVNYEEGSGRGRLIQYQQSMLMAVRTPLVGVGPGNWAVEYPEHAARRDPSLDPNTPGMTYNPWPSSDWVAFVAERGLFAAALLAFAFVMLALRREEDPLVAAARVATVVAAVVAGAFDAVLLLALPALLVWTALGALSGGAAAASAADIETAEPDGLRARRSRWIVAVLVLLLSLGGALRSGGQLAAMQIFATRSDRASLERAAMLDPGNFRVRLRLARSGKRAARCAHAVAAKRLYPNAEAARRLAGCGD